MVTTRIDRDCSPDITIALRQLLDRLLELGETEKGDDGEGSNPEVLTELEADGFSYLLIRIPALRPEQELSPTQKRISRLVADGLQNKEIATSLEMSPHTVAEHLRRIYLKLNIGSRAELAFRAMLLGF